MTAILIASAPVHNCPCICHTMAEVINVNVLQDLPMGFGMALMQNRDAARHFESLPQAEQQRLIGKTHRITSKQEMQMFVATLKTQ